MHLRIRALACAWVASIGSAQQPALTGLCEQLIAAHVPAADDADALCADLLRAARRYARSAASELLVAEALRNVGKLQRPERAVQAIDELLGARPHALTAHVAERFKATLLRTLGRSGEARALDVYRSYARRVLAVGPFGDSGDYYTHTPFAPELRFPGRERKLPGRYGPVGVREVTRKPLQRNLRLASVGSRRSGCFYGLHRVRSGRAVAAYAEIVCGGSYELFVNGARAAAVDRHRDRVPITLRHAIRLQGGTNHVLLKTTLNDRSDIGLRYLDAAGRPVADLEEVFGDLSAPPEIPADTTPAAGAFVDGAAALERAALATRGKPASAEHTTIRLAAALSANRAGWAQRALALQQLLESAPPADGVAALAYASVIENCVMLPAELRRGRARQVVERVAAAEAFANHHHTTIQRVRHLQDQDKREDAIRLLQSRIAAKQAGPDTFGRLYQLLRSLRFHAESRRLRSVWRRELPRDSRPILDEASDLARQGAPAKALDMLLAALRDNPSPALRRRALGLSADLRRAEDALAQLDALHADDPEAITAIIDRSSTLHRLGRSAEALEYDARVATHDEATASQIRAAGDRLLRAGRRDEAIAAYRRALGRRVDDHRLRRLVTRLAGATDFEEAARFRRKPADVLAGFAAGDREKSSTSTLLIDQLIISVQDDGSAVEETHQIRRINDLAGVERHQNARRTASAGEVLTLRTIGAGGKSYVPNRVSGNFGMPRLEPGAFLETRHRNFTDSRAPAPWRLTEFRFQSGTEPFLLSELVVILPKNAPGAFRVRSFTGERERHELQGGRVAHVFRMVDVARLASERGRPPLEDVLPIVTYGEDGDPGATARQDFTNATYYTTSSVIVRSKTAEIVDGLDSDAAKAQAIWRFVNETVSGNDGYGDPTQTLLRKRGSRFFLMAAMLGEAGVPFRHAVADSRREELSREATPFFAGDEEYEVPALVIEPGGGAAQWMFIGAPRWTPLGLIPADRMGAAALLLSEGANEVVRVPIDQPQHQNGLRITGTLTLDQRGDVLLDARGGFRGVTGYRYAEQVRQLEEKVQKLAARQIATQLFGGWTLRDVELTGLAKKGEPLGAHARLRKRKALKPAGDDFLLALPISPTKFLNAFGDRAERTLPMRLSTMLSSSTDILIEPGADYRIVELPDPVRVRHMLVDFNLSFARQGDNVRVKHSIYVKPGTIPPSLFGEWLRLLRRLDLAEEANFKVEKRK